MSTPLLPDAWWNLIQPMLPSTPPHSKGGRPRLPDRASLIGILWMRSDLLALPAIRWGGGLKVSFARNALTCLTLAPSMIPHRACFS